jgi:hypothetical protein
MKLNSNESSSAQSLKQVCKVLVFVGNLSTALGCLGVILGMLGVFDMDFFSLGLSSGIRIIGTVAIAGCLLSAIGYGILDYSNK